MEYEYLNAETESTIGTDDLNLLGQEGFELKHMSVKEIKGLYTKRYYNYIFMRELPVLRKKKVTISKGGIVLIS